MAVVHGSLNDANKCLWDAVLTYLEWPVAKDDQSTLINWILKWIPLTFYIFGLEVPNPV